MIKESPLLRIFFKIPVISFQSVRQPDCHMTKNNSTKGKLKMKKITKSQFS